MDLIFHTSAPASGCEGLLNLIRSKIPGGNVRMSGSIRELRQFLLRPSYEVLAVVLRVADAEELQQLINLRGLLDGFWIILILPDAPWDHSELGHCLRPRLLVQDGGGYHQVGEVLSKMMQIAVREGGWEMKERHAVNVLK